MDTHATDCDYCQYEKDCIPDGEGKMACEECRDMNIEVEDAWDALCSQLEILQDKEAKAMIRHYADVRIERYKLFNKPKHD